MTDEMKVCPECAEQVKARAFLCRYCKFDFRTKTSGRAAAAPAPARRKSSFPVWAIVLIVGVGCCFIVPVIAAIAIPGLLQAQRASNERNASATLKTLAAAEHDFRLNDRDGNGVNDFWTGDVAGLYCMTRADTPGDSDEPIRLIEMSAAAADAAPLEEGAAGGEYGSFTSFLSAKAGYLFQAMTVDDNGDPYAEDTDGKTGPVHNEFGFGFCAFPELHGPGGNQTFIINEDNTVYRTNNGGEPVLQWPSNEELEMVWTRVD